MPARLRSGILRRPARPARQANSSTSADGPFPAHPCRNGSGWYHLATPSMAGAVAEKKKGCHGDLSSTNWLCGNEKLWGLIMMTMPRKRDCGRKAAALALFVLIGAASVEAKSPAAIQADILIRNGHVVDGTGGPWIQANVAITGDKIVYVGRAPVTAKRVIDAAGKVVSPGFIDMHSHSEFGLTLDGRGLSMITQGVTTEVLGEHLSAGPVLGPAVDDPMMITPPVKRSWTTLGGFFDFLTKKGIGPNVVSYVGAGQVRASVMGYENRDPTPAEMAKMKELIVQAMHEGAFGLSAGLVYVPNSFNTTAQMIELAKVAAGMGGIYAPHMRAGDPDTSLRETVAIAKGAHIPVEIFHVGMGVARNPNFVRIV